MRPGAELTLYEGPVGRRRRRASRPTSGRRPRPAIAVGILAPEEDLVGAGAGDGWHAPRPDGLRSVPYGSRARFGARRPRTVCVDSRAGCDRRRHDLCGRRRHRRAGARHPRSPRCAPQTAGFERSFKSENPTGDNVLRCAGWCYHAQLIGPQKALEGTETSGGWLYESREHGGCSGRAAGTFHDVISSRA